MIKYCNNLIFIIRRFLVFEDIIDYKDDEILSSDDDEDDDEDSSGNSEESKDEENLGVEDIKKEE
jgi:hypothetical protein